MVAISACAVFGHGRRVIRKQPRRREERKEREGKRLKSLREDAKTQGAAREHEKRFAFQPSLRLHAPVLRFAKQRSANKD